MPRLVQAPAQGARQLATMQMNEASRLSERGFGLRMARLRELQRDRERLLTMMARLRESRESKKAADEDKGVFGGWGSTGGAAAGALAGTMIMPGMGTLIGAGVGAGIGGGVEAGLSGDPAGATESFVGAAEMGMAARQQFQEHEFFSGGGGAEYPALPPNRFP